MKEKYLINDIRVVCDGKKHHIYRHDGSYTCNDCSCGQYPNNDPKYWESRRGKGQQCSGTKKIGDKVYQCSYPAYHGGNCSHFMEGTL